MDKKFLIIVDMQNKYITNDEIAKTAKNIEKLLIADVFDVIVATMQYHDNTIEDLLDHPDTSENRSMRLHGNIGEYANFIVFNYNDTCVSDTFLQELSLFNHGEIPDEVYVAGIDTDVNVLHTILDLIEKKVRPIVITDCCASRNGTNSHEAGLKCLNNLVGDTNFCKLDEICPF